MWSVGCIMGEMLSGKPLLKAPFHRCLAVMRENGLEIIFRETVKTIVIDLLEKP